MIAAIFLAAGVLFGAILGPSSEGAVDFAETQEATEIMIEASEILSFTGMK